MLKESGFFISTTVGNGRLPSKSTAIVRLRSIDVVFIFRETTSLGLIGSCVGVLTDNECIICYNKNPRELGR